MLDYVKKIARQFAKRNDRVNRSYTPPGDNMRHHYAEFFEIDAAEFAGSTIRLRFKIRSIDRHQSVEDCRVAFMFFVDRNEAVPKVAKAFDRQNANYNANERQICLVIDVPDGAKSFRAFSYTDKGVDTGWEISNLHLLVGDKQVAIGLPGAVEQPVDFEKRWSQKGQRIAVEWLGNTFYADMPQGFRLKSIPKAKLAVVNELLFGNLEYTIFGRDRMLLSKSVPPASDFGRTRKFETTKVCLSFSGGEDSTAALRILPRELTQPFYSERPFREYFNAKGARIRLNDPINEDRALAKVKNVIRVPTNFETIGISVGTTFGYRDNFGYAAIGILIAHHVGANVLAFGSVMEQVLMKSGYDFTDVVHYRSSRYNRYRDLFASIGLYFALPAGVLSEVVTNRICSLSKQQYTAVPCPSTDIRGEPCGVCFKCFRKTRLEGRTDLRPPAANVVTTLKSRPLKSATSLVYAVQKSGYDGTEVDEYLDTDLKFLARYFASHLPLLTPPDLAEAIAKEIEGLGIEPMNKADEAKLREIAKTFYPSSYSEARAYPLGRDIRPESIVRSGDGPVCH